MEFFNNDDDTIGFRNIHPLLAELLRGIPGIVDPAKLTGEAESRLFPDPTLVPELESLRADWQAFVQPDLQSHFQTSRDIVAADLRRLRENEGFFEIPIPRGHADAWLNVLNQARLILASAIGYDEPALETPTAPDLLTEKGVTLFRINLYAFMQECLVESID